SAADARRGRSVRARAGRAAYPRAGRHAGREPVADDAAQGRRAARVVRRQHGSRRDLTMTGNARVMCSRRAASGALPALCSIVYVAGSSALAQPGGFAPPLPADAPIPLAPSVDEVPASPLAEAARRGDVGEVLELLAAGGLDVDGESRDGTPALHWLVRLGE